jgi:CheY-like chemotaxis protein
VREVLARSLRLRGHRVLEARHGGEALDLLASVPVDVVVTDLDMPVLDGDGLARAALQRQPHLPVVFMTGHDDAQPAPIAGKAPLLLRKPFRPEVLARLLGRILVRRRTAPGLPSPPA